MFGRLILVEFIIMVEGDVLIIIMCGVCLAICLELQFSYRYFHVWMESRAILNRRDEQVKE